MISLKKTIPILFVLSLFACKNPTDNIKIIVNTNLIKYSALVQIVDASTGLPPANITLTISGQNANDIYEISGKKIFTVVDGTITIGAGASVSPQVGSPLKFNIIITATGYDTVTKAVQINAGQMQQVLLINMFKTGTNTGVIPTPPVLPVTSTPVTLNFAGTCVNNANLILKPSVYLFYRETGSGAAFNYLGFMDKGVITSSALTLGKTYDFRLTYGGQSYTINQKIETTYYDETVDLGSACSGF